MAEPGDVEADAKENERVRIARLREDAKLPPVARLDQAIRLSRVLTELADTGRHAHEDARR